MPYFPGNFLTPERMALLETADSVGIQKLGQAKVEELLESRCLINKLAHLEIVYGKLGKKGHLLRADLNVTNFSGICLQ